MASNGPVAFNLFYHQAVDDIGKGKIPCGDKLTELRSLKAQGKKKEVSLLMCGLMSVMCVCLFSF